MGDKKILVFGYHGQVASALREIWGSNAHFAGQKEVDFTKSDLVLEYIKKFSPDIIVNASAYTAVDKAEAEVELAKRINHLTPYEISKWVAQNNKSLIHYSTDYVFDGSGNQARNESDATNPLSVYGKTKLEGDNSIMESGARAVILRTSWVYSYIGSNFFRTMLRLGSEKEKLSIVSDQIGSPTYAPDLALITTQILQHSQFIKQSGGEIFNAKGTGFCSWYEFASEIFRLAPEFAINIKVKELVPITSKEYPTPAQRPHNSRLSDEKLYSVFGLRFPSWQDALYRAFVALKSRD